MHTLKHGRSGQILLITALLIALMMASTTTYIYNINSEIKGTETYLLNDYVGSTRLGVKHATISALANATNGGSSAALAANIEKWKNMLESQYMLGKFALSYTLREIEPFSSGMLLFWGANGTGISEAYVEYSVKANGKGMELQLSDFANVSTRLSLEGSLSSAESNLTEVTLVCHLSIEGMPALVESIAFYYMESAEWVVPQHGYAFVDYGNGTYRATFTIDGQVSSADISAHILDRRGIFVMANCTCF